MIATRIRRCLSTPPRRLLSTDISKARLQGARGGGQPGRSQWVVPFSLDEGAARAVFASWAESSSCDLQKITPLFLPFYVFQCQLHGTFTGVHEYSNKREQKIFARRGIKIEVGGMGVGDARTMAVYAGFEYPASYVEDALLTDGRSVASPLPLDAADAPPSTRPLDDDADDALVQSCIAKARSAVFERTHRYIYHMITKITPVEFSVSHSTLIKNRKLAAI